MHLGGFSNLLANEQGRHALQNQRGRPDTPVLDYIMAVCICPGNRGMGSNRHGKAGSRLCRCLASTCKACWAVVADVVPSAALQAAENRLRSR